MQPTPRTPDPAALAVAKAAQGSVHQSTIILFGSRAAGTHRTDSDVDLMLVWRQERVAELSRAQSAVKAYMENHPPILRVDIVPMELEDFLYCRRAKNHVAGQASRKGIAMSNERLDFNSYQEDPDAYDEKYEHDHPRGWPDVKWRLQATYRNLGGFQREFDHPQGEQENYCFHAQQAIENSLKAWISAANLDYSGVHDLDSIAQSVLNHTAESQTPAAQQLRRLLEYATDVDPAHPDQTVNWLTQYATWYRYHGTDHRMTDEERNTFREKITNTARALIDRAQELTGTTDDDLAR